MEDIQRPQAIVDIIEKNPGISVAEAQTLQGEQMDNYRGFLMHALGVTAQELHEMGSEQIQSRLHEQGEEVAA